MKLNNNIKSTLRVARIELNSMFYSPVAWLVLVIFAFQIGIAFVDVFDPQLRAQDLGDELWRLTARVYTGMGGILPPIQRYIYLYIPLITMGLMSREYQSGSIKLLYSSPIKNSSIIFGKFLSMMVYGFALLSVLGVFVLFSAITFVNFDFPMVLVGMLGLYLLILAYSAIGLFMSSITQYQVVAAIGTLAALAVFNFIGEVGQDIDFVRNITYWLSMTGRSGQFLEGMIASEDLFYFLLVIAMFLSLSVVKLNTEKSIMSLKTKILKYSTVVLITVVLGYVTTIPYVKVYVDATYTKSNTLALESQDIIKNLEGGLTITTYVNLLDENYYNGLPRYKNYDLKRFEQYIRYKPEIKMEYVYYYDKVYNPGLADRFPDMTDQERAERLCKIDRLDMNMFQAPGEYERIPELVEEKNQFIRIVKRENGQQALIRLFNDTEQHPAEAEISATLKRLIAPAVRVAFSTGYGSREIDNYGGRGYYLFGHDKHYRQSLLNNGFDTQTIDLDSNEIADDIDVLVISDLRKPLSAVAMAKVLNYIDKGGNLFILGEYARSEYMNQLTASLGVKFSDGVLVQQNGYAPATLITPGFTEESLEQFPQFEKWYKYNMRVIFPSSVYLDYTDVKDFKAVPVLETARGDREVWLEYETTDFEDGEFLFNPEAGERKDNFTTLLALSRKVGDREQRILVSGDADFISNEELTANHPDMSGANYQALLGSFRWLSNDQYPVDTRRADYIDNRIRLPKGCRGWIQWFCWGLFPLGLGAFGLTIIIRRQRK